MTTEIWCGIEVPLYKNPQILSLDEASGAVRLWDHHVEGAARYSLVPSPQESIVGAWSLVPRLALMRDLEFSWVVGWKYDGSGPNRIRSKAIHGRLKKEGWSLLTGQGLGLAILCGNGDRAPASIPAGCEKELQGCVAVFGKNIGLEGLSGKPFDKTMRHFCLTQRLDPSREFVEGLVECGAAVAYVSVSSDAKSGIVFVGSKEIIPNFSKERNGRGFFSKVLKDSDAQLVWE